MKVGARVSGARTEGRLPAAGAHAASAMSLRVEETGDNAVFISVSSTYFLRVIDSMRNVVYNSEMMTPSDQHRAGARPQDTRTTGTASRNPVAAPDRLGEARRAANIIVAAWALRELVALRVSRRTD